MTKISLIEPNQKNQLTNKSIPLVIGFFDVIHSGHQNLLKNNDKEFNILTFKNIPSKKKTIFSFVTRITNLTFLNPNNIFIYDIEQKITIDDFLMLIKKVINPSKIIVGNKFKFGKNKKYGIDKLKEYFSVQVIKQNSISTSKIKKLIEQGNMLKVDSLIKIPYYLQGKVIHGKHNGRKLGYRTANIKLDPHCTEAKSGSYLGFAFVDKHKYDSAIFIRDGIVETHLLNGFNEDIYNKRIVVMPLKFVDKVDTAKDFRNLKEIIKDKINAIEKLFDKLRNK